jgi:hypothetical protein
MRQPVATRLWRAERRAAPKPARIPMGDRPTYSSDEGLAASRAERRAAPKPAVHWRDSSPGRTASPLTPSGDRPTYSSDEGLS